MDKLTDADQRTIARARELADAHTADEICKTTRHSPADDYSMVVASAFGVAQHYMLELARIAERLDSEVSRLRNDRARYRTRLVLEPDDDDREAFREAGQPGRLTPE